MKLNRLKSEIGKYLVIRDKFVIDVVLGNIISNCLIPQHDPVWLLIIGVASGGKTTILSPTVAMLGANGKSAIRMQDIITDKTFLSGYVKNKVNESLLLKMELFQQKVLVFSDFSTVLAMNPIVRGDILAQMRCIYDGKLSKDTGTGHIDWEGRIGFLAATTPAAYRELEQIKGLGERFSYYWMEQPTEMEILKKQSENLSSAHNITEIMKPFYADYFTGVREFIDKHGVPPLVLTPAQQQRVWDAIIFCVKGKASVQMDFRTGKVMNMPDKSGVGRDYKAFTALLRTIHTMDCYEKGDPATVFDEKRLELVEKMAYSAVARERRVILETLANSKTPLAPTKLGTMNGLGLDGESVKRFLYPLNAVGLLYKETKTTPHTFRINEESDRQFILTACKGMQEEKVKTGDDDEAEVNTAAEESWDLESQQENLLREATEKF